MPSEGTYHLRLQQLKTEMERLRTAAEESATAAQLAKKNQADNQSALKELDFMMKNTNAALCKNQEELLNLETNLDKLASQAKELQTLRKQLERDIQKEEGTKDEAEKKTLTITANIKALKASIAQKEHALDGVKLKIGKLEAQLAAATAKLEDAKKELFAAEAMVIKTKSEETALRNLLETVKQHVESVSQDTYNANAELSAATEALKAHIATQTAHADKCASQAASVRAERGKVRIAKEKVDSTCGSLNDFAEKVNVAQQAVGQLASAFQTVSAQADGIRAKLGNQTQAAATQDASARSAKSAADVEAQNAARAKARVETATSAHTNAESAHKEKVQALAARVENLLKAAQKTSDATKKHEKAQADLNARIKEQTEKRKYKETKEEHVKRLEAEKRRLEAQQRGKTLASIISALSRVVSVLATVIPQLRIAAVALGVIDAIVSMCEQTVADSNHMLEQAVHEQDERNREHHIALTDEERAQHASLLKEVALLNEASRLTESIATLNSADNVAREQMSLANREKALESKLHDLSVQMAEQSKRADAALATQKDECQNKVREHDQVRRERDQAATKYAEAEQQLVAAEDSLKLEEEKLHTLSAQKEELKGTKACLDEKLRVISCTKAEAKQRLVELKTQRNNKQTELEQCVANASDRKADVEAQKNAVQNLDAALTAEENNFATIYGEIKQASASVTEDTAELVLVTGTRDAAGKRLASLEQDLQSCESKIDDVDTEVKLCTTRKGKLESTIRSDTQELSVQQRKSEECKDKSKGLQETLDSSSASAQSALQQFRTKESDVDNAQRTANGPVAVDLKDTTPTPQSQRNVQY